MALKAGTALQYWLLEIRSKLWKPVIEVSLDKSPGNWCKHGCIFGDLVSSEYTRYFTWNSTAIEEIKPITIIGREADRVMEFQLNIDLRTVTTLSLFGPHIFKDELLACCRAERACNRRCLLGRTRIRTCSNTNIRNNNVQSSYQHALECR